MNDSPPEPLSMDERFEAAIAEWRSRHSLKDGDPILLLMELFRIHQANWDELRRREIPLLDPLNQQIVGFLEANRSLSAQCETLAGLLRSAARATPSPVINRTAAWLAWLVATVAGYFLGRSWP
jgi:hypothetical protein